MSIADRALGHLFAPLFRLARDPSYLLRFVCDLYRGSKSTRPLWESSTNRYRTDGILSPVSRDISLYRAPFLYMLTIMFVFPSSVNIAGRRFFIASTLSGPDVEASRSRLLVLRTGERASALAVDPSGFGFFPPLGCDHSCGSRNCTTAPSTRYWPEGDGQGR